jgi:arylsulfatase
MVGMNRRTFLQTTGAAAMGAALPGQSRRKPNIVVILADDLGFSDLGCYGSEIRTPNLDALAAKGVRFTQFYNTARCCPTRAALLSGLYPHQAGIGHMVDDRKLPGYQGDLNRNSVTLAEVLRPAGYRTLMCGKWHVTRDLKNNYNWPLQRGFDRYYGIITGGSNYFHPNTLTRDNTPIEAEGDAYHLTDALAEQAVRYVAEYGGQQKPFLLYLAFTAPHWPLHAWERDIAACRGRYREGWDALRRERHRRQIELGVVNPKWPLTPRDARVAAWADTPDQEWHQRRMEVYAAQIEQLDRGVGRLVEQLKKSGELDNTLILFLADNGGCAEELGPRVSGAHYRANTRDGRAVRPGNSPSIMPGPDDTYASYGVGWANASNTPFRLYKHWVHEGGISTPLIAHWPAAIRDGGRLNHQPGHLIDIMATCVDVGQARYPETYEGQPIQPREGRSFAGALRGTKRAENDRIGWEHEGNRALREKNWKLVSRFNNNSEWELYDLETDRSEMRNLAAEQPARVAAMAARYEAWGRRTRVAPWKQVLPGA